MKKLPLLDALRAVLRACDDSYAVADVRRPVRRSLARETYLRSYIEHLFNDVIIRTAIQMTGSKEEAERLLREISDERQASAMLASPHDGWSGVARLPKPA